MSAEAQLPLFAELPAREDTNGNGDADLVEAVRQLVAEDGMSPDEVEAVVADALREMGWTAEASSLPRRCRCERALVLVPGTCFWCGRAPALEEGAS